MNIKHYAIALLLLSVSACGGGGPHSAKDDVTTNQSADVFENIANHPKPTSLPPVALGHVGVGPGFEFTVEDVEQRTTIDSSTKAAAGETLVVMKYDFKNTSSEPISRTQRPKMMLIDGQGRSYSDDGAAGLGLTGLGDATTDTNPGMVARVSAVWKVDKASFDAGGWTLKLATDPALMFALQ